MLSIPFFVCSFFRIFSICIRSLSFLFSSVFLSCPHGPNPSSGSILNVSVPDIVILYPVFRSRISPSSDIQGPNRCRTTLRRLKEVTLCFLASFTRILFHSPRDEGCRFRAELRSVYTLPTHTYKRRRRQHCTEPLQCVGRSHLLQRRARLLWLPSRRRDL